nr:2-C-methyl-D-erythritol 4-phosphate cytidylyltransferase [Mangrovactinospora gilvigrisea]
MKERNLNASAIVPAAGRGERLGPGAPKALRTLGGVPMLVHAVRALCRARSIGRVVVVAPPEEVADVRAMLDADRGVEGADVRVVPGGADRQESVRLGLDAVADDSEIVLVHDAARPLVPIGVIESVVAAVAAGADAVVPVLPVTDTVKRVGPADADGAEPVLDTPDRSVLRAVQTPQGFRRAVLEKAHREAGPGAPITDDAGLVELAGGRVVAVRGHEHAFKVTRPLDLVFAEALLAHRSVADGF